MSTASVDSKDALEIQNDGVYTVEPAAVVLRLCMSFGSM